MPSVVYVGRISDGLYLFHKFTPHLMRFILETVGIEVTIFDVLSPGVRFGLLGTVTLLLATLSWKLIERPFLSLKQHFSDRPIAPGSSN